jgi:hypothetical protein
MTKLIVCLFVALAIGSIAEDPIPGCPPRCDLSTTR